VLGQSLATGSFLQAFNDDGLPFLDCLILHTRQGYYGDPAYGGNQGKVGWKSVDFPGPESLKDTVTMEYSIREFYQDDLSWEELIPHLRDSA
jgi:gluconate 2-dehydrogenase gamma chain